MKWIPALFVLATCAGCAAPRPPRAVPGASAAAVGVSLDQLGTSLGRARGKLSEVDAKAIRIQEAIRNW